jgi:DNA-binding MarR family transcriptional regulator
MVVRKLDPSDRRNNLIFLTSKSEAKWELIIDCAWELEKASCQGLSEKELELAKIFLGKIAKNVAGLSQKSNPIDSRRENNNMINIRKQQPLQHEKEKQF